MPDRSDTTTYVTCIGPACPGNPAEPRPGCPECTYKMAGTAPVGLISISEIRREVLHLLCTLCSGPHSTLGPAGISASKTPLSPPPPPETRQAAEPIAMAPPPASALPSNDHAPHSTAEATRTILSGLSEGSLARSTELPRPSLARDIRISAKLDRKIALGPSCWGERNWIGICGGEWSATWGKGKIVVCLLRRDFRLVAEARRWRGEGTPD